MKRFFAFAGLMTAAAISLTNCQPKEIGADVLPAGKTIYLSASTDAGTRTTNDGMKTLWEAQDSLNVFFSDPTAATYTSLGKATITDGAGTASATLEVTVPSTVALPDGAAIWYAFFPYISKMAAPDGTSGYAYLGHSKGVNQNGFDSMAHLRGNVCPMYAVAEGNGSTVSFSMKHLTSVIEFNVTNSTSSDITVNKITYKASEDIVGTYYFDIANKEVAYAPSGATYVYDSASVNMENGTLAAGGSGKVYLPIKPYTQSGPLTITVNCTVAGKAVETVITKNPSGDQAVFSAGMIKKVNVDISSLEEQSDKISEVHAAASGSTVVVKDVIVSSVMKQGFFVTDNTDVLYVFLKTAPSVTAGQKVSVSGTTKLYQGNKQINNEPAPEISASGEGKVTLSPVTYTGADVDAAFADNNAKYVTVEATATSTTLASVEGATECVLYIANNNRAEGVTISKDKKYTLTGYVYGHGTYSGTKQIYFYAESAVEVGGTTQEATLTVSPTSVSIPQEGGSADVTVTCDNAKWTVDGSTVPDWLSYTASASSITFTASANESTKRSATVTVNHPNGTLTKTVKVSQEGAVVADALSLSAASISFGSTGNEPFVVNVTCNNPDWTIDSSTVPSWLTVTPDTQSDPMTITIVAQDNTGEARNAEIVVNHSNGEISRTLKVGQNAASSGGTATYVKVTSASALTDGQYLIVNEEGGVAMNGGLTSLDAAGNNKQVTISGNSITWSGDDIYFTYNSSEKSLCGAGGAYLAHKQTSNNILNDVTEYDASTCVLDISFDADGNAIIAPPTGYNLRYNASSGQERFRFYKSTSSQKLIQLYKKK